MKEGQARVSRGPGLPGVLGNGPGFKACGSSTAGPAGEAWIRSEEAVYGGGNEHCLWSQTDLGSNSGSPTYWLDVGQLGLSEPHSSHL